ncbi:MAG: T9SS type A sorting domain-containing protein [Bacteroidota bacterium]
MKNALTLLMATYFSATFLSAQTVETITDPFPASGGISVSPSGTVYVSNFGTAVDNADGFEVWEIQPDGSRSIFANGIFGAAANNFDSQGNLFQSNIGSNRINKITPTGQSTVFVTQGMSSPIGLVLDSADNLYVCNCGNNTIQRVAPNGTSTLFSSGMLFNCPHGIAIDERGHLFVSNFNDGNVIEVSPDGFASLFAVIPGDRNGHIRYSQGRFFVASHGSNNIYLLTTNGFVSLFAGTGVRGDADGPALSASFSIPNGIGATSSGDTLYVNCSVPTTLYPPTINPSVVRRITGVNLALRAFDPASAEIAKLTISPNPNDGRFHIAYELTRPQIMKMEVFDMGGGNIHQQAFGLQEGSQKLDIQLNEVPAGQYLLRLSGERLSVNRTFIVR